MTSYATNTAAADITTNTHFTPNGVPGVGDDITIGNGHTLTNPVGNTVTLGVDATYGICLRTSGTGGTGIFVNKGTLILKGGVQQGAAIWKLFASSVIEFDRTCAHATACKWQIQDATSQSSWLQTDAGVDATHRAEVRGSASGSNTYPYFVDHGSFNGSGQFDVSYVNFRRIRNNTGNKFCDFSCDRSTSVTRLTYCLFDDCGVINSTQNIHATGKVSFKGSLWKNTTGAINNITIAGQAGYTAGTERDFVEACPDRFCQLNLVMDYSKCLMYVAASGLMSTNKAPHSWSDMLWMKDADGRDTTMQADVATATLGRTYVCFTGATINNAHGVGWNSGMATDAKLDQWYFDGCGVSVSNPGMNGDMIFNIPGSTRTPARVDVTRAINVGTLTAAIGRIGSLNGNPSGGGTTKMSLKHCTGICGSYNVQGASWDSEDGPAMATVGEAGTTAPNTQVDALEDGIAWTPPSCYGGAVVTRYGSITSFTDPAIPSAIKAIVGFGLHAANNGSDGWGYYQGSSASVIFSTAPEAVNQLDPNFAGINISTLHITGVGAVNLAHWDMKLAASESTSVTSISGSSQTPNAGMTFKTVTTGAAHSLLPNDFVTLAGASVSEYNRAFPIFDTPSTTTFRVLVPNGTADPTGTITITRRGSARHALAELRKQYDPDATWNTAYTLTALFTAFEAAWQPQLATLLTLVYNNALVTVPGALPLLVSVTQYSRNRTALAGHQRPSVRGVSYT